MSYNFIELRRVHNTPHIFQDQPLLTLSQLGQAHHPEGFYAVCGCGTRSDHGKQESMERLSPGLAFPSQKRWLPKNKMVTAVRIWV